MSDTTVTANLTVQQWDDQYFAEYVRDSRFKRYMGTSENSVIVLKEDLTSKKGTKIWVPFVGKLNSQGVTGNTALEGNEEQLDNYGHGIAVDTLRNGVVITANEEQKGPIDLRNAAKSMLKLWSMEDLRGGTGAKRGVIDALGEFWSGSTKTAYADTSEAVKDAFLASNSDRFLFGSAKSNNASNDHSAALANVDATDDKLTKDVVSLAKRIAKTASPIIRPIRVSEDEEWYVMFANSLAFRDLKTSLQSINQNAEVRGKQNPLYRDGDLIWDGVIVREIPEIPVISSVGASSINVAPNYLCGAQAVGVAWAKRPRSRTQTTDYEFRYGVGIEEMRGVDKLIFNSKQNGVVTVYTAGVADT